MITYTGTLQGDGQFSGLGITENVAQTDAVTLNISINSDGSYSGTEDQVITTTVTIAGLAPVTSTYDSGFVAVSGNVNTSNTTTTTENGNTVTVVYQFSTEGDSLQTYHTTVDVSGLDSYDSAGISGSFGFTGTLSADYADIARQIYAYVESQGTNPTQTNAFIEECAARAQTVRKGHSQNLVLRDTEYYFFGVGAANYDPYLLVIEGATAFAYVPGKFVLQGVHLDQLIPETQPGNPASPAGGYSAMITGELDGFSGKWFNDATNAGQDPTIDLYERSSTTQTTDIVEGLYTYHIVDTQSVPAVANLFIYDMMNTPLDVSSVSNVTVIESVNGQTIHLSNANASIMLADGANVVYAGGGTVGVVAGAGNNTLYSGAGNDMFAGGAGWNRVVYNLASNLAGFTEDGNGVWTITTSGKTDTLANVAVAQFTDRTIALRQPTGSDFLGDDTSDILFRNSSSGDTWFEAMSNGDFNGWNQIGGSNSSYSVVGTGKFLEDGTSDILFRNSSTGDTWVEAISNGGFSGWYQIGGSDTRYSVIGVGDVYGNGSADILFRNNSTGDTWCEAISNGRFAGWQPVGGSDTHYAVVGIGDLIGNGTDDILFRNNSTGDLWFEAMSNGQSAGWQDIGGSDTHYSVVGVGDFFSNGTDDILFRNNSTGDTWIEAISSGAFAGWQQVGGSDTHYAVVAVGDYFGNGTDDVLFRNNSTGDTWFEAISNGASAGWNLVGGSNASYTVKT
jgi:RTX calcium-binding nonapeptide repeat (4 copies)